MANITLNTKVYTPAQMDQSGAYRYFNNGTGVPTSFSNLTAKVALGPKQSRVRWRLAIPVIATDPSACACPSDVLRVHYVDVTYDAPSTAPTTERSDARLRLKDLVANAQFIDAWDNLIQPTS